MILKFNHFINETFESPVPIKWSVGEDKMKGKFKIGYEDYVITAKINPKLKDLNSWYYKFYWNDGGDIIYSLTGIGKDKFRVMATVINGFKDLIEYKKPDSIIFHANLSEDSRVKFYNKLMEKATQQYGYSLEKFPLKHNKINVLTYILYKNKEHLEKLKNFSVPTEKGLDKLK
jgi:hypothetical protein